eukprot:scaffold99105_cov25-Cyclotella_meneghiniana.AAC.1
MSMQWCMVMTWNLEACMFKWVIVCIADHIHSRQPSQSHLPHQSKDIAVYNVKLPFVVNGTNRGCNVGLNDK